jgi:pyruvate carboxylase
MKNNIFVTPGMSPREIVSRVRALPGVCLTSTGMRDAGQSDYKNRLRHHDLATLAPFYNEMGLFSAECHGGARWHVGIMNRKESPFDELQRLREKMPNVLLQTLVREASLWGYRPYPKNVIEQVVNNVDIDVWRCFSFLNDIRNMRVAAEVIMKRGRLFAPTVSFTQADWATDQYYLNVVKEIVSLCSGVDEIILVIKDMAGVGSPKRITGLVACIKQAYPELVVQYHRHTTDGLALPVLLAAAQSGAQILDVQEDSLTRFYGQPPILSVQAYLEESEIPVHLNRPAAEGAVQKVRDWVGQYDWAESPFKGLDHGVHGHRMPGGAFPSSFEQAQKGGFLQLMPAILTVMSLYNKVIKYFDVTPGSQITWTTCSGMVNKYAKENGEMGVRHLIALLTRFIEEKQQDFFALTKDEQRELLGLFCNAPDDFKNLILGQYGRMPSGWPDDWVYKSAFGKNWRNALASRQDISPLELLEDENLEAAHQRLEEQLRREPTDEEFILYLMHPKDALEYFDFKERFGEAPYVLPTNVWREGLKKPGDSVEFEVCGKPFSIELVSVGAEHEGLIHVVMRVNNKTRLYTVSTPRVRKTETRMAKTLGDVGSPINGTLWRLGNPKRGILKTGDIVRQGEEMANIEAMKMETAISSPFDAHVIEINVKVNDIVKEGQLLFVLEKIEKAE